MRRLSLMILTMWMLGCVGNTTTGPDEPGGSGGGSGGGGSGSGSGGGSGSGSGGGSGDPGGLVPGSLDVAWMHGLANCAQNTDPEVQVHRYNDTTYILRQNKCDTFEAPFVYLLLGAQSALLLDSGATNSARLRELITPLVGARPVLVAHSHAHGDHVAGDATFAGLAGFTVVGRSQAAVQAAFAITAWPTSPGTLELGGRTLDALAVPGHEATHVILYDRQTGLVLTGDTLYPGFLFISNWTEYRASIRRLAQFLATRPVSHVLGAHVEMSSTPKVAYPYRTIYQPAEHVLQLTGAHVTQLDAALTALGANPPNQAVAYDDFIIDPQ